MELHFKGGGPNESMEPHVTIELLSLEKLIISAMTRELFRFLSHFHLPKLLVIKALTPESQNFRTTDVAINLPRLKVIRTEPHLDICALLQAPKLTTLAASKVRHWPIHDDIGRALKDALSNITTLEINSAGLPSLGWFEQLRILKYSHPCGPVSDPEAYATIELCHSLLSRGTLTGINVLERSLAFGKRYFLKLSPTVHVTPRLAELHIMTPIPATPPSFHAKTISALKQVVLERIATENPLKVLAIPTHSLSVGDVDWLRDHVPKLIPHSE
jgi:hypothetical protein